MLHKAISMPWLYSQGKSIALSKLFKNTYSEKTGKNQFSRDQNPGMHRLNSNYFLKSSKLINYFKTL